MIRDSTQPRVEGAPKQYTTLTPPTSLLIWARSKQGGRLLMSVYAVPVFPLDPSTRSRPAHQRKPEETTN